jgi:hypothetical protein
MLGLLLKGHEEEPDIPAPFPILLANNAVDAAIVRGAIDR